MPVNGKQASLNQLLLYKLLSPTSQAADEGAAECNAISEKGQTRREKGSSTYPHGAANYAMGIFNMGTFMLKGVETALCHFRLSMGMAPDKDKVAAGSTEETTKTFGSKTVKLTVVKGDG